MTMRARERKSWSYTYLSIIMHWCYMLIQGLGPYEYSMVEAVEWAMGAFFLFSFSPLLSSYNQ